MSQEVYDAGMSVRRAVLGDDYVDASLANADELTQPLQDLVTEYCWGRVWTRDGLPRETRSLLNIVMMVALNRPHELRLHLRGALRNGCTPQEISEAVLQTAIYAGVPAALDGFRIVREVLADHEVANEAVEHP